MKRAKSRRRQQSRRFRRFRPPPLPQDAPNSHLSWPEQVDAECRSKVQFTFLDRSQLGRGEEALDEGVWGRGLPDDVFCTVLACLPLSSFHRLKCVCKKWAAAAADRIFLAAHTRLCRQEPSLFLASHDGPYWMYEHGLDAWTRVPGSFFQPTDPENGRCALITAAGSRLVFIRSSGHFDVMLYNPLNGSQRTLPPMLDMSGNFGLPQATEIHIVGMYMDAARSYYNILVSDRRTNEGDDQGGDDSDDDEELVYGPDGITSQIYDSRTDAWQLIECFAPRYELRMLNSAVFGDALHCLTVAGHRKPHAWDRGLVDELTLYTLLPEGWEADPLRVPTRDHPLCAPHLFVFRGRPLLAVAVPVRPAPVSKEPNGFPQWQRIIIWELEMVHDVPYSWAKFAELDLEGLPARFDATEDSFVFLSEGDCLYFGSSTGSVLGVVNVAARTWLLLPPFPAFRPELRPAARRFSAFVYQPRFDVVA